MLPHAAVKGLEELNHYELNGKAIRVMPSQRDPSNRKSGVANVFIKVSENAKLSGSIPLSPYLLSVLPLHLSSYRVCKCADAGSPS